LTVGEHRPPTPRYEVLVAGRPSAEDLDASPDLRHLVIPFAGLPPSTRELLLERPHLEARNLHHNAAPTAELAIGLLLAAARGLVPADRALRAGDWRPRYATDRGTLLDGGSAVVLGYGAIGRRVARALAGLGMRVRAIRRTGGEAEEQGGVVVRGPEALDDALEGARALVVAVPLTDETRGMIDARRLGLLEHGAVVVNVARGPVVDERSLYEALVRGHLGGAGLDVWWRYPESAEGRESTPPSHHPFAGLDRVVMSPHRAGHADRTEALRAAHLISLLDALARGASAGPPLDPRVGY
jgi:phosphoglycerate dehydrogenase-like enzyme